MKPKQSNRPIPKAAPAIYRPQPLPRVLQAKMNSAKAPVNGSAPAKAPTGPPAVYRPQPLPRVLQRKTKDQPLPVSSRPVSRSIGARGLPSAKSHSHSMMRGNAVVQPSCFAGVCAWIGSLFKSGNNYERMEMEDLGSQLPQWGSATFLGFHWTAYWDEIKRTGDFRPGGGSFGEGYYLCKSDHRWVPMVYTSLNVLLEVGYVGDMSGWNTLELNNPSEYKRRDDVAGQYDIIKTKHDEGTQNQICYKLDGPGHVIRANFRVRLARR